MVDAGPLGPLLFCQELNALNPIHFIDDLQAQQGFSSFRVESLFRNGSAPQ